MLQLELIKDYDLGINYHSGKANVVANTLCQKSQCNMLTLEVMQLALEKFYLGLVNNNEAVVMEIDSTL